MGHGAMWLSHTTVPDRNRAVLVQCPLSFEELFGPHFAEVVTHLQTVSDDPPPDGQRGLDQARRRHHECPSSPPPPQPPPEQQRQHVFLPVAGCF
ncbi:hypothetical protein NHX12_001990 [Muraenolepis orangiensis]|uniref:Uncharacterized protein n=1 Tax=Muraenolepis orangiensis TaxID=630683 RepID=A0A9Q0IHR1_9TELE|nr:hypothetical protein NHX12_001990 [Muraenolepis orangiensis]